MTDSKAPCPNCGTTTWTVRLTIGTLDACNTCAPPTKRELTEYEKGYLDGVLAYSYRSDDEIYVGKNRLTTYKAAALGFLRKQGIDTEGWSVNVR